METIVFPSHQKPEVSVTKSGGGEIPILTPRQWGVIKRNGCLVPFDEIKIKVAITKAFLAVEGNSAATSSRIHEKIEALVRQVTQAFQRRLPNGGSIPIEDIQDQVELSLMRIGEYKVARAYVLYREKHARERAEKSKQTPKIKTILVTAEDGKQISLDVRQLENLLTEASAGLPDVNVNALLTEALRNLYSGIPQKEINRALIMVTRPLIEQEPNYTFVAARLLCADLKNEAFAFLKLALQEKITEIYAAYFPQYIQKGIEYELLDKRLAKFDLNKLGQALIARRDLQFTYLGLQTLYDRYLIHFHGQHFELPQAFFMRVAMGLAINETDFNAKAIEFYHVLSSFDFMCSTPTLFNAGTLKPQLSSCYLTTVPDDLTGIYNAMRDNALLSKFAGGLGNDWTPVRALGSHIKGTNGKSQGVVPFLKVANDTAVAVNQGGKRKGALCSYLETWHLDIEEFLDLRKNTGDDRRRTHDMNTANWVPDLFMKRVLENKEWTLFSPNEVPDLHERFGKEFEKAYTAYEEKADKGEIKLFKRIPAPTLWRKILTLLFETGHPWITFKDPCNLRSPQQHVGVVHSSNLCTEITLNTSLEEIAVCNLGSINLAAHVDEEGLNAKKLQHTVRTAMRMLDNVIDINYYSVPQAKHSNLKHRPVGLGIMGFQDALYRQKIPYASEQAVQFADESMELVSFYAILASTELAEERGRYASFEHSLWSKGILPIDSIKLLAETRDNHTLEQDRTERLDWESLRKRVIMSGMRNSNCLAIAPTATISNICGVSQSIEPTFQNLFVKSNLSGEFTVVNLYLVNELKTRNLWDRVMVNDLKYFDGCIQQIPRIPTELKTRFATAFEIDPIWLIEAASRRQKWIDQAQSLNLYIAEPSGKKLDAIYKTAWLKGLKTTYYLRSKSATSTEKSTLMDKVLNAVDAREACSITNGEACEVCQ